MWSAVGLTKLEWNEKIVADLDSSLNKWADDLPEHRKYGRTIVKSPSLKPLLVKWDPNRENTEHFRQSVMLYTTYYWVQVRTLPISMLCTMLIVQIVKIFVHRPFIPRPGEDSLLSFPSLAIAANAARSCLHVIEVQHQRDAGLIVMPNVMVSANIRDFALMLSCHVHNFRCLASTASWYYC